MVFLFLSFTKYFSSPKLCIPIDSLISGRTTHVIRIRIIQGLQVLAECYSMSSSEAPYNKLWINWLNMLLKLIKFDKDEKLQDIIVEFFNPAHNVTIFEQYLTEQVYKYVYMYVIVDAGSVYRLLISAPGKMNVSQC